MPSFCDDVWNGLRALARDPGLAVLGTVTIAVGVGVNLAIFAILERAVLNPLPFRAPDRIVEVYNSYPAQNFPKVSANLVMYDQFRPAVEAFAALSLWRGESGYVGPEARMERLAGRHVTVAYFDVLSVAPEAGRFFGPEAATPGNDRQVVISHRLWRERYRGALDALGQTLWLDGQAYEIVGVAPIQLSQYEPDTEYWRPWAYTAADVDWGRRHLNDAQMLARLADGQTVDAATAQIAALDQLYFDAHANPRVRDLLINGQHRTVVASHAEELAAPHRPILWVVQAGVFCVLLIAGINLANLLLVRSLRRQKTWAVQLALGARRAHLVRQMLGQGLALALLGGLMALPLAWGTIRLLEGTIDELVRPGLPLALSVPMLVLGGLLALLAGGGAAALPLLNLRLKTLHRALQGEGRGATLSTASKWAIMALVVLQIAVAFVLATTGSLLVRSLQNALAIDPGFTHEDVVVGWTSFAQDEDSEAGERRGVMLRQIEARLAGLPGVEAAAVSSALPLGGVGRLVVTIRGFERTDQTPDAYIYNVSPAFFPLLEIPPVAGEVFAAGSTMDLMVSERFRTRYFDGEPMLGAEVVLGPPPADDAPWTRVVGVVPDLKQQSLTETGEVPFLFRNIYAHSPRWFAVLAKSARPPESVLNEMGRVLREIDSRLILQNGGALGARIAASLNRPRALVVVFATLAILAGLLAALGLFGVLTYVVTQQRREIGIRLALGATRGRIVRDVLAEAGRKAATGLVLGLGLLVAFERAIRQLELFAVEPLDVQTILLVALVLGAIALLTAWLPARRAARTNPAELLR